LSVTDYLRIFRRFWWLVAVFAIVGALVGYASWFVTPGWEDTYRAMVKTVARERSEGHVMVVEYIPAV